MNTDHRTFEHCDYLVVGAGSAGCVVAARLSENSNVNVLLLEAGGSDDHRDVRDPTRWPKLLAGQLDWGFQSAPLKHCHNRIDRVPRAKLLGGCHSHNACAWVRGHRHDFDSWAYQGCHGWGWTDVLALYRKIEDWHGPTSELRGVGGPMYVAPPVDPNPIASAFVQAGRAVGMPVLEDNNGPEMEGTSFFNLTIKGGERFSVVQAYLEPAMPRPNLTVRTDAATERLVIEQGRCVGVTYRKNGQVVQVRARQEVILSAGVFGSPCLLMLSGIGRAEDLKRLGINTVVNLPGVGQNLQDHPLVGGINYECKGRLPRPRNNGAEGTLWWRSRSGLIGPDIQAVILEFPFGTPELADRLPSRRCYAVAPSVVRVASRGSVTLTSPDPFDAPRIDVNFMASDADLRAMLTALELCREMGASDAFSEFRQREVMPGKLNRRDMIEFIRQGTTTYFHPTGTCKMGIDAESVVDPELRVYGIEGLRIADASIMHSVTSGNTNAPTVMIGEKAAEMIVG